MEKLRTRHKHTCISSISNIIFLSLSHPTVIRLCSAGSFIFSAVWQHCFVAMTLFALSHVRVPEYPLVYVQVCVCGPCQRNSLPTFAFCPKIKQHWQEIVLASYAQLLPTCHCCPGIGRNIRSTCVRRSIRGDGSKCAYVPVCVRSLWQDASSEKNSKVAGKVNLKKHSRHTYEYTVVCMRLCKISLHQFLLLLLFFSYSFCWQL